jgi:hypothetical protein
MLIRRLEWLFCLPLGLECRTSAELDMVLRYPRTDVYPFGSRLVTESYFG